MTSLCGILFSGGALIYSDLQATSGGRLRSSSTETKVYQAADQRVLLAGTGSVEGILKAKEAAGREIRVWRSMNGLRPIPPTDVGEILRKVMEPEDEAYFLLAAYNVENDQAEIAEISESGFAWKHGLVQVNGSGTPYMHSPALKLEEKVLATISSKITTTEQMYQALPKLKFPQKVAMLEGLEVIHCGPKSDVFSGGRGYQLMVVTQKGVCEYIIPKDEAEKLLKAKWAAELATINSESTPQKISYEKTFERWKVKK